VQKNYNESIREYATRLLKDKILNLKNVHALKFIEKISTEKVSNQNFARK